VLIKQLHCSDGTEI